MSTNEEEVVAGTEEQAAPDEAGEARAAEQKRIDGEFAQAARERARVQQEAAALLDRATQRLEEASRPKPQAEDDKPPARDQFDTYEEFLEAKLDYQKREVTGIVAQQVKSALAMQREDSEHVLANTKAREASRRGADLYPGFDDAVNKIPVMPPAAVIACAELPEPEHVLHYLGTHTEEARKIGRMTPGRVAHAIIALGDQLEQERKAKAGAKEEPAEFGPKPGGKTAPSGPSANMNMEQYEKSRIQEKLRLMK